MADEEAKKYLIAAKGFSANGVTVAEGDYLTDQFDDQTVKVLKGMGRIVETDTPPSKKRGKKEDADTGAAGPGAGGLPGLPGT